MASCSQHHPNGGAATSNNQTATSAARLILFVQTYGKAQDCCWANLGNTCYQPLQGSLTTCEGGGGRACVFMSSDSGCVNFVTSTGLFSELTLEELVFLHHEYYSIFCCNRKLEPSEIQLWKQQWYLHSYLLGITVVRRIAPEKVSFEVPMCSYIWCTISSSNW
jgi:hypothetical protein